MYETVDTFQVLCAVSLYEANVFLNDLKAIYPQYENYFDCFIAGRHRKFRYTIKNYLPIGIQAINLYRSSQYPNTIYIAISVNPEMLCSKQETTRLFCCTPQNVFALQVYFADAMYDICPSSFNFNPDIIDDNAGYTIEYFNDNSINDRTSWPIGLASLPYLGLLIPKRIDYTLNCYSENPKLTLELLGKSYIDLRKHDGKKKTSKRKASDVEEAALIPDVDNQTDELARHYNFNLYYKNTVSSDCAYDKKLKYDLFGCDNPFLYWEAENTIRLETSRRKCQKAWIVKKAGLRLEKTERPFGVLPYLEPIVADYMLNTFIEKFGRQDWYSDEESKAIIEAAVDEGIIPKTVTKTGVERANSKHFTILHSILPIVSQSRSLTKAMENYQTGTYTIAGTQEIVTGSKEVFQDYIKLIRAAGLQPLRIPDRKGIKHMENPIKNIKCSFQEHKTLPSRIQAMPEVMNMIRKINEAHVRQHTNYRANFN